MWVAAGTHKRPRPRVVFSPGRVRRARALESPCQAPEVVRQRVTGGSGVTLSFRVGSRPREASRSAKQRDLTASQSQKTKSHTCTTRERTCASDVQRKYTAQAAHAHVRSHDTPTWFHCASRVSLQQDTNMHKNHVRVRAQPPRFSLHHHVPDRPTRGVLV